MVLLLQMCGKCGVFLQIGVVMQSNIDYNFILLVSENSAYSIKNYSLTD